MTLASRSLLVVRAASAVVVAALAVGSHTAADAPTPAPPVRYQVYDLGPLPKIADDVALGINDADDVVCWVKAGDNVRAEIASAAGGTALELPAGYRNAVGRGVNKQGQVVGWANTSGNPVDSLSTTRAFLFDGKTVRVLPTLGGRDSRGMAVNDRGEVAGVADRADGSRHAFLFHGNAMMDLPPLAGASFSEAFAVNNSGVAAGVSTTSTDAKHAVLWRDGKPLDLGALPGGRDSGAFAINDRGDAVGYSESPHGYHAVLFHAGKPLDLGTLGGDPSEASGINNRGDIVGSSSLARFGRHGFLWTAGRIWDLNALINRNTGWTIVRAYAVNDRRDIACVARWTTPADFNGHAPAPGEHALLLRVRISTDAAI